jgi:hypothetical protein
MNWLEHIKKARAEDKEEKYNQISGTYHIWGVDKGSLLKVHQMIVLGTQRYGKKLQKQC